VITPSSCASSCITLSSIASLLTSDRAWNPEKEDATASSNNEQALFLCLLFVIFGGCAWEALCLPSRFFSDSNLRTAATLTLGIVTGSSFWLYQRSKLMPYEKTLMQTAMPAQNLLKSGGQL